MSEDQDTMQDAIKVLLDRMREYPEEFMDRTISAYRDGSKSEFNRFWRIADLIRASMRGDHKGLDPLAFLSDQERVSLFEGMRAAQRQTFVTEVMTTLVAPAENTKEERLRAANTAVNGLYPSAQLAATNPGINYSEMAKQQAMYSQRLTQQEHANQLAAQNVWRQP